MRIEEELFYGYQWNEDKLIPFGFVLQNNKYVKQYQIHHNEFTACIEISKDHINGKRSLIIISMKNIPFLETIK